jgi:ArsR family transcriptional regulator, arsenate/arsenite/antimonite-responsive transcriptional repressor
VLRQAGLIDTERDPVDARWIYYSVNESALDALSGAFGQFLNPERIQPRHPNCGPASVRSIQISTS